MMREFHALKTNEVTELERRNQETVRSMAGECVVLLENDGALPLKEGQRTLALYGNGARHTVKGGTGSGDVNSREVISIDGGLKTAGFSVSSEDWLDRYDKALSDALTQHMEKAEAIAKERGVPVAMLSFEMPFVEPDVPPVTEEDVEKSATDVAIYVLSRNSGEGKDRSYQAGDYLLSEGEQNNIRFLANHYNTLIVLLNVGGIIDTTALKGIEGINSILLISQLGNIGGNVVADVLTGVQPPSGKLTDTWAVRYEDYPFSGEYSHNNGNVDDEYYKEGIYVGYRYFDTFHITPSYCFGYGKGYTEFEIQTVSVTVDGADISLQVEVINTGGQYAGKEVVQVYYSAPKGSIDKPYQELVAFAKTGMLQPGETETLSLTFSAAAMASYFTEEEAWKLEAGTYLLRVGNSSRSTSLVAGITLDKTVVTRKVKHVFGDCGPFEELRAASDEGGTQEDQQAAIQLTLRAEDIVTETVEYRKDRPEYQDSRSGEVLTMEDVKEKKASLEELVAQLTVEEMAALCVGTFPEHQQDMSIIGAASMDAPGAAADTISTLKESRGIGNLILADGPAGLRLQPHFKATAEGELLPGGEIFGISFQPFPENTPEDAVDYYQYCTAIPIASALAQSWNMELIYKMGEIVGTEMKQFGVHLWLAPGMNIHRNPLCGRNFEYYSEDPVLTGKCAAADTKGVQASGGQGTTIKHFAANNQEDNRMFNNAHVSERSMRELYLKGFEIAIKEAQPYAIMTSYNLLNGTHTANHYGLIQMVARDEWGFEGVVMTDWFTSVDMTAVGMPAGKYPCSSSPQCIYAGNDLQMPGNKSNVDDIIAGVKSGEISLADLQFCVMNILRMIQKCRG